jgi:hypothetical protein
MHLLFDVVEVFGQILIAFVRAIFQIIAELPISQMSLIKALVDDSITITSVVWIDEILLMIAGLIPPGVVALITSRIGVELDGNATFVVLIIVYGLTIMVFQSIFFWVIVGLIFVLVVLICIFGDKEGIRD